MTIEQTPMNAHCFGCFDIGPTVVDKERFIVLQTITLQQNFVDARLGLHRMLLARDDLAVEQPINRKAAQESEDRKSVV